MIDERVHLVRGIRAPYILVHQDTVDEIGQDGLAAAISALGIQPSQLGTPKLHPHSYRPRQFWTIPVTGPDE